MWRFCLSRYICCSVGNRPRHRESLPAATTGTVYSSPCLGAGLPAPVAEAERRRTEPGKLVSGLAVSNPNLRRAGPAPWRLSGAARTAATLASGRSSVTGGEERTSPVLIGLILADFSHTHSAMLLLHTAPYRHTGDRDPLQQPRVQTSLTPHIASNLLTGF